MPIHAITDMSRMEAAGEGFFFSVDDAARASEARPLFVEYLLRRCDGDTDQYSAELIFGELTGNVMQHAPGPMSVSLTWENGRALLEVWDRGPGYKIRTALPDDNAESGRGLSIVAILGRELRVDQRGDYTVTSVTLPVSPRLTDVVD